MGLRFCANLSFMFQESASIIDRYKLASECGFKGVECAFLYDQPLADIIQKKNTLGLEQVLINVDPGDLQKGELGFAALPEQQARFQSSLNLAIDYAKQLDCKLIHIMSGKANVSVENNEAYEKNLRWAVNLLEKENIVGLIEPINKYSVPGYYMNCYDRAVELLNRIKSPNLKLMMDIFHLQQIKGNLTNNIKQWLPLVGHIQIAQVPFRGEPNTCGEINYPYIFQLLEQEKYKGWIGLEYKPEDNTKHGLKWINEFKYKI